MQLVFSTPRNLNLTNARLEITKGEINSKIMSNSFSRRRQQLKSPACRNNSRLKTYRRVGCQPGCSHALPKTKNRSQPQPARTHTVTKEKAHSPRTTKHDSIDKQTKNCA